MTLLIAVECALKYFSIFLKTLIVKVSKLL